jgi:type I restriction enzyme S subunit
MIFYKENEFKKDVEVGSIPKGWEVVRLKEVVVEAKSGFACGKRDENGILQLRMDNIEAEGWINTKAGVKVPEPENVEDYILRPGDILFNNTNSVDLIGKTAIFKGEFSRCVYSNHLTRIRVDYSKTVPEWILYCLIRKWRLGVFKTICHRHVHQAGINNEDLLRLKIPLPPLEEQRAFAGVLGVVDSVIAKTDEVIAKTERLKKGLMQTLLTRGIGHKEFKETEIGKIPKTWQVVRIKDVAEIRGNKRINDFEKIAFIPMELIPDSQIFAKYEIRTKEDVKSFTYCEAGDILLAKITPSLENGKQGVVPFDVPDGFALATTEVFPIRCKNIDRFFLFYVLKFSKFRDKIISSMIGTTGRQRATRDSVEKLEIPLPPLEEQQKIGGILSEVDKKLELERNEKAKLERIKRGLMDLLLTGKVRVKVEVNCDAVCSG